MAPTVHGLESHQGRISREQFFVVFSMGGAVGQRRQVSTAETSQKALVIPQEQFLVKVVGMSVRVQRPFPDGSKCCTETNESAAIGI